MSSSVMIHKYQECVTPVNNLSRCLMMDSKVDSKLIGVNNYCSDNIADVFLSLVLC